MTSTGRGIGHSWFTFAKRSATSSGSVAAASRDALAAFSLRVLGAVAALAALSVLARSGGSGEVGRFSLAMTIVAVAAVFSRLGYDQVALRFSAVAMDRGVVDVRAVVLALLRRLFLPSVGIGLGLAAAAGVVQSALEQPGLASPLRLLALSVPFLAVVNVVGEALKGVGRTGAATFCQAVVGSTLLFVGLLVISPADAVWAAKLMLVGAAVAAGLAVRFVARLGQPRGWRGASDVPMRAMSQAARPLMAVAVLNLIVSQGDVLVVGLSAPATEVGLYAAAARLAMILSMMLSAVNAGVAGSLARMFARGEFGQLRRYVGRLTAGMAAMSCVLFATGLVFAEHIVAVFGDDFVPAAQLLRVLLIGQCVALASGPMAALLIMTGHERHHRATVVASTVVAVGGWAILAPGHGAIAVAWVTSFALVVKNALGLAVALSVPSVGLGRSASEFPDG